jgi:hypothetical protein
MDVRKFGQKQANNIFGLGVARMSGSHSGTEIFTLYIVRAVDCPRRRSERSSFLSLCRMLQLLHFAGD